MHHIFGGSGAFSAQLGSGANTSVIATESNPPIGIHIGIALDRCEMQKAF
jgi:hypothetical protein